MIKKTCGHCQYLMLNFDGEAYVCVKTFAPREIKATDSACKAFKKGLVGCAKCVYMSRSNVKFLGGAQQICEKIREKYFDALTGCQYTRHPSIYKMNPRGHCKHFVVRATPLNARR